jgi:hypothetical protein
MTAQKSFGIDLYGTSPDLFNFDPVRWLTDTRTDGDRYLLAELPARFDGSNRF